MIPSCSSLVTRQGINGVQVTTNTVVSLPVAFTHFGIGVGCKAGYAEHSHGDDTGVGWVSTTQACFYTDAQSTTETMHGLFIGY